MCAVTNIHIWEKDLADVCKKTFVFNVTYVFSRYAFGASLKPETGFPVSPALGQLFKVANRFLHILKRVGSS
jgi:hypothetical protein